MRRTFSSEQMNVVKEAVALAEELTSNHFKYSTSQWRRSRYDIRTLRDLHGHEIINGAFAQILRYVGRPKGSALGSKRFDFYKICIQDHEILRALEEDPRLDLYPLMVYVTTHELVHIVRFSRFLQMFEVYPSERLEEECRVHAITGEILSSIRVSGVQALVEAYQDARHVLQFPVDQVAEGP